MSVYMTEEEQIAAIKNWWNKYSTIVTLILSLILVVAAGYRYWNWHQEKISTQASTAYEHLMLAFSNQDDRGIQAYSKQLMTNYKHTVYADAARLSLAKLQITSEDYTQAKKNLDYVATHSKMPALKQIAKLRLARLLTAEKAYDKALAELSTVIDKAYTPVVKELKGDIFAAKGQYQEAIQSYKEAISGVRINGMGNLFLEMKTNELAALSQSMNNKAIEPQAG
jgi:predicted negative regulator of RcsB-dependent stress response